MKQKKKRMKKKIKRILNILVTCILFIFLILFFNIFKNSVMNVINLTSLKMENEKIIGNVTELVKIGGKGSILQIKYDYEYLNKKYHGNIKISHGILKRLFLGRVFNDYYVGKKITVLVKPDNTLTFLQNEIGVTLFYNIIYILLNIIFIVIILRLSIKKIFSKLPKMNNSKNEYYRFYKQENNYKIKTITMGNIININDIANIIDYKGLKNNEIICCGIEFGKDFIEISYFENEFQLRISKNKEEKIIEIKENMRINELVYNYIKNDNCA